MKTYSLDVLTDKYIGKKGTKKRDEFEKDLRLDLAFFGPPLPNLKYPEQQKEDADVVCSC